MNPSITVLDEKGCIIGKTYLKRAKGLVKKGRAVFIDDTTIRLCEEFGSDGERKKDV